jgi:hypothetical protein
MPEGGETPRILCERTRKASLAHSRLARWSMAAPACGHKVNALENVLLDAGRPVI